MKRLNTDRPSLKKFPRSSRLLNKKEFSTIFSAAEKVSHRHFIALYKKNTIGLARVGIIVSKKVASQANQRNKIKRVVRESFRENQNILPNIDVVILAKRSIDQLNKPELRVGIDKLWQKLIAQYLKSYLVS